MKTSWHSDHRRVWLVIAVILTAGFSASTTCADGPSFLEAYADPSNARNIVAVFDSASRGIYLLRSTDGGATWAKVSGPDGTVARRSGPQDVSDFFVRQTKGSNQRLVIVYAKFELFRAGADVRWEKLTGAPADVQQVIPTDDPQRFFLVASAGQGSAIYFTDTDAQSWAKRAEKLPFTCNLRDCDLIASSDGDMIAYRAFGGDGYSSSDGGRTWQSQSTDRIGKAFSSLGSSRGSAIKGTSNQVRAARDAINKPIGTR